MFKGKEKEGKASIDFEFISIFICTQLQLKMSYK